MSGVLVFRSTEATCPALSSGRESAEHVTTLRYLFNTRAVVGDSVTEVTDEPSGIL